MTDKTAYDKFYGIFRGNTFAYIKHQPPFTRDASGKVSASWVGFVKNKEGGCEPVTQDLYAAHLKGENGLAVSPITDVKTQKNVCFYAVIDIDCTGNFTHLVKRLYLLGFKFAAFASKSGGLHIYFFFMSGEKAASVVETLTQIVDIFALKKLYKNIEIFPRQTSWSETAKGSCLLLPYYACEDDRFKQKLLTSDNKLLPLEAAIPIIESMFTTLEDVDAVIDGLPCSDAPYCIQAITLLGLLGEKDGRNKFLFNAAIYLKKKYKEDFLQPLLDVNNSFLLPLEEKEAEAVYKSVLEKSYDKFACKDSPCADFCDKKLCVERIFSPGSSKKGNKFTNADCWGDITKVCAEEPYYLWEVRVNPEDEFKTIRLDRVSDLGNQSVIRDACWKDLNWSPYTVGNNDWIDIVNKSMLGIEERYKKVEKETDTSEANELKSMFATYLTQKQSSIAYKVLLGSVIVEGGYYYFTTEGFKKHLTSERFSLSKINLREKLISYGCSDGELTLPDDKKKIKCWKHPVDDELKQMSDIYDKALVTQQQDDEKTVSF